MTKYAETLEHAKVIALTRLIRIAHESADDQQARLAAEAILRLKPLEESTPMAVGLPAAAALAEVRTSPATTISAGEPPLSPDEIQHLHVLLPHVRPERFTRKHRPGHWRQVLAQLSQQPLKHAG